MTKRTNDDLEPLRLGELSWQSLDAAAASLRTVHTHVDTHARRAIDWYLARRRVRKTASRVLRLLALVLAVAGGVVPLLDGAVLPRGLHNLGYLLIAVGGALMLANRVMGLSAAWIRYMQTALRLQATVNAFQLKWAEIECEMGGHPTPKQIRAALHAVKLFAQRIDELILTETDRWSADFAEDLERLETLSQQQTLGEPRPSA
jgi:hypothetical protein